jgi:predicted nucleotidyltransferase
MDWGELPLSSVHRGVVERFVAAAAADSRVIAATLYGSYATGGADQHSDLDLSLITTDDAYPEFVAERETFVRRLGEPVLLEDFDSTTTLLMIFAGGAEVELTIGRAGQLNLNHGGAFRVLLDKQNILAGATSTRVLPPYAEQVETLRRQIYWFWHDLSHFCAALGRGQLWWACGQIGELRRICVNLARLRQDFSDPDVGSDPYFKLELSLPAEQVAALEATFCPMERAALLTAARALVRYYRDVVPALAQAHGIAYPDILERVVVARLDELGRADLPA